LTPAVQDATATRQRITRRILPWVSLLYIIAYLDRSNVGYAGLEMTKDLHFSPQVFGFGAGVFFIGYFTLDIPGSMLVEKWSARKWIAAILVTWGLIASATGFIQTAAQLYALRFLLGLAEGGFFPGIIVYLSHWFRQKDRGKAAALFLTAIPISQIVCGPASAYLLRVHWLNLAGWRWMLILEGLPAVVCGIVTLFFLTDRPSDAAWLTGEERQRVTAELEAERAATPRYHQRLIRLLANRDVLLLSATLFFFSIANYGLLLWMPKIIQAAAKSDASQTSLLSTIPFLCGLPVAFIAGSLSDRKKERIRHASIYSALLGAALLLSQIPGEHWAVQLVCFAFAVSAVYAFNPVFYLLPSTLMTGTEAAASMGLVNGVGHLGGFVGPYTLGWLAEGATGYTHGILFLAASAILGSLFLFGIERSKQRF
jgi:ACS family tartrate transporter-like MFS transporter